MDHEHSSINRVLRLLTGALFVLAFGLLLFYRGLNDPDEGRYGEIPREMVASGNWMQMRLMGYWYYEKPPLAYWAGAAAIKLFGASAGAARLPLLPVALATAALAFFLARKYWGREAALRSSAIFVTSVGFFIGMAFLLTDNFLVLWFSLACVLLYEGYKPDVPTARRYGLILGAAFFVYLGALSKGLVAVVLPAAILFLWLAWERRLRLLWQGPTWAAAALFFLLIVPTTWFIEQHNPGFFKAFFIDEHFSRFTGTREIQGHPEPFWFYIPIIPLLLLPWSLFIIRMVRNMIKQRAIQQDELTRFLTLWAVVVVVFFSISSGKLISYIMPALIPFGLILGRWAFVEPLDGTSVDRKLWRTGLAVIPLMSVVLLVAWWLAYHHIIPEDLARPAPITFAFLIPSIILLTFMLVIRTFRSWPVFVLLLSFNYLALAVLVSPLGGKDFNGRLNSSCAIYEELARRLQPEDQVIMFKHYRPSFAFYINRVPWLYQVLNEMKPGILAEPERPGYLPDRASLEAAVIKHKNARWYIMLERHKLHELDERAIPYDPQFVAEDPVRVIVELKLR